MEDLGDNFVRLLKTLMKSVKQELGYAVEFPDDMEWLNTQEALTLEKLKGQVVLLDFWTYCCINCIHILDDLKYLEEKYEKEPFVVIGVHSAKFKNEQDKINIRSALARYEIKHPVLIDNEMKLWKKFKISAWPSFVLIGPDSKIIGKTAGEGQRTMLENSIEDALEKGRKNKNLASKKIETKQDIFLDSYLKFPGKLDMNRSENQLFVSDSNHNRILQLQLKEYNTAKVLSIIGSNRAGLRDGSFEKALFNKPQGILYSKNKLYIADTNNHVIRKVDLKKNKVSTIAGTGKPGRIKNYEGNPLKVSLNSPWDIEIFKDFLYIAMAGAHQIWRLDLKDNVIKSFAGSGKEDIIDGKLKNAALAQPSGLSVDRNNKRLYFADSEVSALRYIDLEKMEVKTLIGKGLFRFGMRSGNFADALLQHPIGIAYHQGRIFVADTYNHAIRVADLNSQKIENLIFRPRKGICKIGDKDCDVLPLNEPNDVFYYNNKLYIADTNNHLIRIFDIKLQKLDDLYILLSI